MTALGVAEIERVFRAEYGRAVAVLVRAFGSIDMAEDAVQEAFMAATRHWPSVRAKAKIRDANIPYAAASPIRCRLAATAGYDPRIGAGMA